MRSRSFTHNQQGAVSIFIVVFTALLVTIVATSFIQLMLNSQQQASNNDLSQSAYDSALAGVEDAKRALVRLERCRVNNQTQCVADIKSALNSKSCDSLSDNRVNTADFVGGEVTVGDPEQNQAYTCVVVQLDTKSVTGELDSDGNTKVIELRGTDEFDTVRISWFSKKDLSSGQSPTFLEPTTAGDYLLPRSINDWGTTTPPIMRARFIEFSTNQDLPSLDNKAYTRFLYPASAGLNDFKFEDDSRLNPGPNNQPLPTECKSQFDDPVTPANSVTYLCYAEIELPNHIIANDKLGYLTITSIYGGAFYKVELINGDGPSDLIVPFDGVQPIVDSTGRASDLFRRVQANVSVGGLPADFPNAAVNVKGNLCKDFFVTNRASDYQSNYNELDDECTP